MRYLLTDTEMRQADEYAIQGLGKSVLELMENAGLALANKVEEISPSGKILCVCGGGNNGGDGFVAARILKSRGREVDLLCIAEKFSAPCKMNMDKWRERGEVLTKIPQKEYSLVLDCLFGTGLTRGVDGENAKLIKALNDMPVPILSADIPSGVNGYNGKVETVAIKAAYTLCFGELKTGVFFLEGADYAGQVSAQDIGISLQAEKEYAYLIDETEVLKCLPMRQRHSHKGSFGKAAIVAGSLQYTGAAYLSALACLRSGAGYTSLFLPAEILPHYILKIPEVLLSPICEGSSFHFDEAKLQALLAYDSIAYGMGMVESKSVSEGAVYLLKNYTGRLILDADALNSLAKYEKENLPSLFQNKKCDVILTPHLKEYSRLSGKSIKEIEIDPFCVKEFSKQYGVSVLLKNSVSILFGKGEIAINITGNSGLAKGGSGDVLSGLLAGLCAMGASAFESGLIGSYLLGKAAEIATERMGEYSLTASDVIDNLGKAFLFVTENSNKSGGK